MAEILKLLIGLGLISTVKLQDECILSPRFCSLLPSHMTVSYGEEAIKQPYWVVPHDCYFKNMLACNIYNPCVIPAAYEIFKTMAVKEFEPMAIRLKSENVKPEQADLMAALWGYCDPDMREEYLRVVPLTHTMHCPLFPSKVTPAVAVAMAIELGAKEKCNSCATQLQVLGLASQPEAANAILVASLCPEVCTSLLKSDVAFPINDLTIEKVMEVCTSRTLEGMYQVKNALDFLKYVSSLPPSERVNELLRAGMYNREASCYAGQVQDCMDLMLVSEDYGGERRLTCVTTASLRKTRESRVCSAYYNQSLEALGIADMWQDVTEKVNLCWL
ncbi:ORF90 [Ranid herpesvirus 2]|uniref:ORF90 n=1 Tax=Ranid herpesvirus 2 TaxID=389214 RepID=Q14W16_9VIRU|nr:ORF90 [Ranid herpesvirus 2]ABG25633.1 ORF90 [Ranid herpesvirus 2]